MAIDPIDNMKAPELRAEIHMMRNSISNFVSNYNENVDVLSAMEETIIDLDAENESLQIKLEALLVTIAILAEDV